MSELPEWLKKRIENKAKIDAIKELTKELEKEGIRLPIYLSLLERSGRHLAYLGAFLFSFSVTVLVFIFNFLLFVWLLHIEF